MTIKTSEGVILEPGYTAKGEIKLVSDDGKINRFEDATLLVVDEDTITYTLKDSGHISKRQRDLINLDRDLGQYFEEKPSLIQFIKGKSFRRYQLEWEESKGKER